MVGSHAESSPLHGAQITSNPWLRGALDVAVVLGALATIPLTVLQERGARSQALDTMDWAVWGVFAVEFLLILCLAPRAQFRRLSTAADLAVVILSFPLLPNVLALVRLARIVRLLRLTRLTAVTVRGVAALKEILGRRGLVYVVAITTLLILVGGGCLSILEPETVKGGYGDGIWWAIVTASNCRIRRHCSYNPCRPPDRRSFDARWDRAHVYAGSVNHEPLRSADLEHGNAGCCRSTRSHRANAGEAFSGMLKSESPGTLCVY